MKAERFLTLAADAVAIVIGGGGMTLNLWTFYASGRVDTGVMTICAGLLAARTAVGVWSLRPVSPGESATPGAPSPSTPSSPPLPSSSPSTPS